MKLFFKSLLLLAVLFQFSGCLKKKETIHLPQNKNYSTSSLGSYFWGKNSYKDLDLAINEIANQLLLNITSNNHKNYKIALTTLVQLDDFSKTTSFGRTVSESLINELHARRFQVIDLRTRQLITVNDTGEFVLTREVEELKDEIGATYTLVGTYSILDDNRIVINARIMDIFTSDVISTARVMYQYENCEKYDLCKGESAKRVPEQLNILEEK